MSTATAKRIGPKMTECARYVKAHPGCTKYEASCWVGPHGSAAYGWAIVRRTLRAGWIVDRGTESRSALYVKGHKG